DSPQAAVRTENPAVIEALEDAGLARLLTADTATAMRAQIIENVDSAACVAIEDEVAACNGPREKRAWFRQFAIMAKVQPAAFEDLLVFEIEDVLVRKDAP